MDRGKLAHLLDLVKRGEIGVEAAADRIAPGSGPPVTATVDHERAARCGFPEVVYAPGKTSDDLVRIAVEILSRSTRLLITRVDDAHWSALSSALPDAVRHDRARAVTVHRGVSPVRVPGIAIVTAGTSDVPVAEEARVTAEAMGQAPVSIYDVGVAGLHRLLARHDEIRAARVLIVVAGMEGALASVVGGLVDRPVIAVPTSVGYGMNLSGVTALLAMMNSCAPNVSVVNIDNGFGAGYLATLINRPCP